MVLAIFSTLFCVLTYINSFIFMIILWGKYYYHLHFTDEHTEAQKVSNLLKVTH